MDGFLETALSFPTVIYCLFFVVVTVYWLFVVLGTLDIDIIDVGGDLEALAEGATEGAESIGGLPGLLSALRLRSAPFTVTFSLLTAFGFLFSYLGTRLLAPALGPVLPTVAWGSLLFVAALALAVPITAVMTRPLGRLFQTHAAPTREALLGKLCELRTGHVDGHFGQAEVADGGAGHLIEVRCDSPNELKKGDQALVIDYDRQREAFVIEPMAHILGDDEPPREEDEEIAEALAEA